MSMYRDQAHPRIPVTKIAIASAVGIIGLTTLLGSWYTVDQGDRGVILRNGAIVGVAEPGLGFKVPLVDSVIDISIQSKSRQYPDVQSYSRDQQPATLLLSVNYRLPADQVKEIYANYGGEEGVVSRLIDRKVFEQVKNVFGQFTAVSAIQERARLNAEIALAIKASVSGPVIIESVQIENIDFSTAYETSIEQRMLAEVEVAKLRQNAEREKVQAQIAVTQAQGQADSTIAIAKAKAEAVILAGEAEAKAIAAKGRALAENPALVTLIQAEKWNGALPLTMVPGSTVPFLQVK